MRLIDADKLLEAMNERYNEKKDIVSDNLAEGFMQMDKLIHEQDAFDLADHDKRVRNEVIEELHKRLKEEIRLNPKIIYVDNKDYLSVARGSVLEVIHDTLSQMKGEQNES